MIPFILGMWYNLDFYLEGVRMCQVFLDVTRDSQDHDPLGRGRTPMFRKMLQDDGTSLLKPSMFVQKKNAPTTLACQLETS